MQLTGCVDKRDWSSLSLPEQIRQTEVEGYCVFPGQLAEKQIAELKAAVAGWKTVGRDYSERQRSCTLLRTEPLGAAPDADDSGNRGGAVLTPGSAAGDDGSAVCGFISPYLREGPGSGAAAALLGHAPTLEFLRALLGDAVVCFSYQYDRSEVGTPGLSLHAGAKPFGSRVSGTHYVDVSSPVYLRCLYYLDDLTLEVSPFRIVPRSHISLHADANPYQRYESHPEQVIITLKAGSMILFHESAFHGTYASRTFVCFFRARSL